MTLAIQMDELMVALDKGRGSRWRPLRRVALADPASLLFSFVLQV